MRTRQCGFTLVELIVTVAVTAILLTVAIPSFWAVIQDNRLTSQANDFITDTYLARSEAITRGQRVTMCRCVSNASTGQCTENSGQFTCDDGNSTNWNQGWVIFVDADSDAEHDGAATEPVIRVHERLPAGFDLTGNQFVADYISYDRRGITLMTTGAMQSGTLTLKNANRETAGSKILKRFIVINSSGAVESCNPNHATCS